MSYTQATFSGVSLDAAGLVALADISSIATRTAIIGSASALDALFLAPGIHRQQFAAEVINNGEHPATAALTDGYVFRVENQATVSFLQRVGVTGHLVNLKVEKDTASRFWNWHCFKGGVLSSILFLIGPVLTLVSLAVLGAIRDWWGLGSVGALVVARLINVVVMRKRSQRGWKGSVQPSAPSLSSPSCVLWISAVAQQCILTRCSAKGLESRKNTAIFWCWSVKTDGSGCRAWWTTSRPSQLARGFGTPDHWKALRSQWQH